MIATSAPDGSVAELASFVRTERPAILRAWTKRIATLRADGPSLATHASAVVDWLERSLGRGNAESTDSPPLGEGFSAPRAIAELAFLTETIERLRPSSADEVARDSLHQIIDGAIAQSVAREADAIERVRKRLRLATDVTLVGSWELDPISGVVVLDARSRELFGVTGAMPTTLDLLTSSLHADDRPRVREGIQQTLASGRPYMAQCRTVPSGSAALRWIAIAADAHHAPAANTPTLLGIVHDISAAKRAEEEHARVVEELSRAVHISEMFVGILSHDLRNPLSGILGAAQLLAPSMKDAQSTRLVSMVVSSGERMGRMVEQLLDFTRARLGDGIPLDYALVDLAVLAREVVEENRASSTSADVRLTAHGDTAGTWDRDRICQILSNLVGNALQHGRTGGSIDVAVDGTDPDCVVLSVENEGVIPLALLPVIFNPFRGTVQKRGVSSGLGLGLYVARQIALAHGGDLAAEATEKGTVFVLRLPRLAPRSPPSRQELVREEELAAFEHMAAPPSTSAVTAQMFGATPLHERAPLEHSDIVDRYRALLDTALHLKTYRGPGNDLAENVRALAERLGDLGASPREVTEVHARALRDAVRGTTAAKAQALLTEGRLLALELMGNVASYYRRRARGRVRSQNGGTS